MLDKMFKWEMVNGRTINVSSECWIEPGVTLIDYLSRLIDNMGSDSMSVVMTRSGN